MGQQLNIKSDEARGLAAALSELTGESLTATVTIALRERLERERTARNRDAKFDRIMSIAADIRARMGEPLPSSDHSWLYDEMGLPK